MPSEKKKELNALISLLDEPNDDIYTTVREKIFSYGALAIPSLEDAWENSFDHLIQHRIEELIHKIQFESVKGDLAGWIAEGSSDLMEGYLIMTRYQYPDVDTAALIREVGRISQDVWLELNTQLTPLEKVKVINHVFFDVYKFSGNRSNITSPENYYLKTLLETKKGTPLSLGMLYMMIAQSLGVPIYGIDLPRHFILAYTENILTGNQHYSAARVKFYLNPFNRGAVFTENEVELYIRQMKLDKKNRYFKPCRNPMIIRRLAEELRTSYELAGNKEKMDEVTELLAIISQDDQNPD